MTTATRTIRAPRGTSLTCKGWQQEAALRMLMNNLDPEVAERPDDLVVYGGTGKAARNWRAFDAIVATLKTLADDETLLVQSGKPVGVFRTHEDAPRVLIANANLVGRWATWEGFRELERAGFPRRGGESPGPGGAVGGGGPPQGRAAVGRLGRELRRRSTRGGAPRMGPGCSDRPDLGARRAERLRAGRAHPRRRGAAAL